MSKKLYPEESIQAIADSIRSKRNVQLAHVGKMKTSVMADAIKGIRLGCPISVSVHMQDGVWTRPATETFKVGENNYNKFTSPSYAYFLVHDSCRHLTRASLLEIGKMLGTVTTKHYLQIGTELSNLLTADEKAEITAKGWTIT